MCVFKETIQTVDTSQAREWRLQGPVSAPTAAVATGNTVDALDGRVRTLGVRIWLVGCRKLGPGAEEMGTGPQPLPVAPVRLGACVDSGQRSPLMVRPVYSRRSSTPCG